MKLEWKTFTDWIESIFVILGSIWMLLFLTLFAINFKSIKASWTDNHFDVELAQHYLIQNLESQLHFRGNMSFEDIEKFGLNYESEGWHGEESLTKWSKKYIEMMRAK